MTSEDISILLKYLQKAVVPQADQDAFIKALEHLLAIQNHLVAAA